jgi:hypothetical protein
LPGWDTFAVIIGGAAGALIGLLFVSVSIRIEVISASPDFRNRGAATLSLFTTVLLVAVLLGISQPLRAAAARTIVSTPVPAATAPGEPTIPRPASAPARPGLADLTSLVLALARCGRGTLTPPQPRH